MAPAHSNEPPEDDYITINGQRVELEKHPTDFTVIGEPAVARSDSLQNLGRVAGNVARMRVSCQADLSSLMAQAGAEAVPNHVYLVKGTGEEILVDDRIILTLDHSDSDVLERVTRDFHLTPAGRLGESHVLRLTAASGGTPVQVANRIAKRSGVRECHPQILVEQRRQMRA